MKIAIWSYANLERVYGITFSLARFLRSQGHEVRVLYIGETNKHFVDDNGIEICSVHSPDQRGARRVWTFWRSVWRSHAQDDAIILVGTRSALFSWPIWKRRQGKTIVFAYELDGDGRMETLANRIVRSVDHLIEVNAHRARLRALVARQPDAVVRNVPDRKTVQQIQALHALPRTPIPGKIMYGGLIAHYQGIDLLVRAFSQSNASELELIGNYESLEYIDRIKSIPVPKGKILKITNHINRQALMDRLWKEASALICLYPYDNLTSRMGKLNTKYAEPTKYYEYLHLGIPLVTFRHISLPQNGEGIFVVSQTQSAITCGLNQAIACTNERNGHAFVRSIDIGTYEDELSSIIPLLGFSSNRAGCPQ